MARTVEALLRRASGLCAFFVVVGGLCVPLASWRSRCSCRSAPGLEGCRIARVRVPRALVWSCRRVYQRVCRLLGLGLAINLLVQVLVQCSSRGLALESAGRRLSEKARPFLGWRPSFLKRGVKLLAEPLARAFARAPNDFLKSGGTFFGSWRVLLSVRGRIGVWFRP